MSLLYSVFFFMVLRPPISTRLATLFPDTTLYRSRLGPRPLRQERTSVSRHRRHVHGLHGRLPPCDRGGRRVSHWPRGAQGVQRISRSGEEDRKRTRLNSSP